MTKPLESFTLHDWMETRRELSAMTYGRLSRTARALRIPMPAPARTRNAVPVITLEFPLDRAARITRIEDTAALKKFKSDIDEWSRKVVIELKGSVSLCKLKGKAHSSHKPGAGLLESIEHYVKNDDEFHEEPVRIGFRFHRHGVHLHYGAGRGYGRNVGSRWIDRYGVERHTNPKSLGKAGTGKRPQWDWFNPVLERRLPELADIAASYCSEMIINSDFIYIH